jgi:benzoyl-CoA reductase/2-hydroxyglutaryl-CoA dehydratase subunit BcrC/BadD/HgdB
MQADIVGFTTTIPIEILLAAHKIPLDLNNVFITHADSASLIDRVEASGFPQSYCCWIKGIYGAIHERLIPRIIGVVEGDCSNTRTLLDVLTSEHIDVIPFAYPYKRTAHHMGNAIEELMCNFNVSWEEVYKQYSALLPIRNKLVDIHGMIRDGYMFSSAALHTAQVSSSDMCSDIAVYEKMLDDVIASGQKDSTHYVHIGYIGVPPIIPELFEYIDTLGARVIFHEVGKQFTFSMHASLKVSFTEFKEHYIQQFLSYTYPYAMDTRLVDITKHCTELQLHGLIHYSQSFCHRGADDILLRKHAPIPILTIEEDRPGPLSARTKLRVEAFIKMLSHF